MKQKKGNKEGKDGQKSYKTENKMAIVTPSISVIS